MRCKKVRRLIDNHVDGLLPAAKAERVRAHLDDCEDCRAETEAARAASTSLAVWGDLEPPASCFDSILARIEHLPDEALERGRERTPLVFSLLRGRRAQWISTGGLAAAAVLLAGAGLDTPRPVSSRRPPVRIQPVDFPHFTGFAMPLRPAARLVGPAPSTNRPPVFSSNGVRKRDVVLPDAEAPRNPADLLPEEGPR